MALHAWFAIVSSVLIGTTYSAIKLHFNHGFAHKFFLPAIVVAAINCSAIYDEIGWWVVAAYPVLFLFGTFISAKLPFRMTFDLCRSGGIFLVGIASIVLSLVSLLLA